jgi:hypothetical protein
MAISRYWLCSDCGHIARFKDLIEAETLPCSCGGNLCGCIACQIIALDRMLSGVHPELSVNAPVVI